MVAGMKDGCWDGRMVAGMKDGCWDGREVPICCKDTKGEVLAWQMRNVSW